MSWLLLVDPAASGARNMALDAALLESADATGLHAIRLYAWNPGTLSFGRNEPATRRYDRDAIRAKNLATVRRPTGGRAVWHNREVTYAVAAPSDTFGTLQHSYREIHAMLADALRSLGAGVSLAAPRPSAAVGAGACFASAAGGEVIAPDGRKVVGSAQVRSANAFLQHGSILLSADQDVVSAVTIGDAEPPSAAGLADLVDRDMAGWDAVSDAVARAAARRWGTMEKDSPAPDAVLERASVLEDQFADDAWTWRR